MSSISDTGRQPVVGEAVTHQSHGHGTLRGAWEGHVEVAFASALITYGDADGLTLLPSHRRGEWVLLNEADADLHIADLERVRCAALAKVHQSFTENFLHSDSQFKAGSAAFLSRNEYELEKVKFVTQWFARSQQLTSEQRITTSPDHQQALAIATVNGNVQLVARAGSGKTETVANRAVFLQRHCGVAPTEMLLLAFNRSAAKEMTERVRQKLGSTPLPHIMTFHALAKALVPGPATLLVNAPDKGEKTRDSFFQRVVIDAMASPEFQRLVQRLMLAHFRADWESIVSGGLNLNPDELLAFRRSQLSETLRGEYVKSAAEKVIANFLFEHDIPYLYEQRHWVRGQDYRPDFTVPKSGTMSHGVVIEYFGYIGDPDYDTISAMKRDYWASKGSRWVFIELGPADWNRDAKVLSARLQQELTNAGVTFYKLTERQIWQNVRERAIFRFTESVSSFVGRSRKQWRTPDAVRELMLTHDFSSDVERWFVELAVEIYDMYLDRLDATSADDFDGLLQTAVRAIDGGQTRFSRRLGSGNLKHIQYLFVDEYQDFTALFHQLIDALRAINPAVQLFCVGDDWQAINRFAGSDLKFYRSFRQLFEPARRLQLTTNRRSKCTVVRISNALMQGKGIPAAYATDEEGTVAVADFSTFQPTSLEASIFKQSLSIPVVLRLSGSALAAGQSVVLLSARNILADPGGHQFGLDEFLSVVRKQLPARVRDRLSISTVHGFKGNQSDVVIILDANETSYPLIHPSWSFSRILGESESEIVNESRRLFYVALTRAKHALYILTESGRRSPFLDEISHHTTLTDVSWSSFPQILQDDDWLVVKVGVFGRPIDQIKPLFNGLKADSFRYRDLGNAGGDLTWDRAYRITGLRDGFLIDSPWMVQARAIGTSGVQVHFFDALDKIRARGEIVGGKLLMRSTAGTSTEFDIDRLRKAFA